MTEPFPTTIVVPLYGDLPTAERCIRSVLETVDLTVHRLLIVNDVGPEADAIESRILEIVGEADGVRYFRNPRNLGFVGTCNRAVFELDDTDNDILLLNSDAALLPGTVDEMSRVLHLSEKHGVVTARSNHATIATIPLRTRRNIEASPERSLEVFRAICADLPRYSIVPVAHGFCFLTRRSLVRIHGLFDEVFAPGYGEENDYCLRLNNYGYSAVMANRAYAIHDGEKSFSSLDQRSIQDSHEALIVKRYPFYQDSVRHHLTDGVDPIDWFADFLVPSDEPKKVLIDLHHMSLIYDGSVRNALTFLEFMRSRAAAGELAGIDFVIAASAEAIKFFQLRRFGFRVVSNSDLDELFDLGFSLAPITAQGQILRLNRLCVRWVASHLDIISLRVLPLLETEYSRRQVVFDSLRFADHVIAISESTLQDTIDYFPALEPDLRARTTVIHQGVAENSLRKPSEAFDHHHVLSERQSDVVREGGYLLVIGNVFRHKQLAEATLALRGSSRKVVAFGSTEPLNSGNVIPIKGGYLTDSDVSTLYENAAAIVYPSTYEGFGLPIAEAALHEKPLLVFDTRIAREVVEALGLQDCTQFFQDFDDLSEAAESAISRFRPSTTPVRSIEEYNQGILALIRSTLSAPCDIARLRARQHYFRSVVTYRESVARPMERALSRRSVRLAAAVADKLEFLRPVARAARRAALRPKKS